jgi:hypothetical protein
MARALRGRDEGEEKMQVYVVMGNDLPDAVFSTKDAADDYVAKRKLEHHR